MNAPRIINRKETPEGIIQQDIIKYLRYREWMVKETHGNMFSSGWPDLYACHSKYGARWIEVKQPTGYCFTAAQLEDFPKFSAHGVGIWILVAATESEYQKLWSPSNWSFYLMLLNPRHAHGKCIT